MNLITSNIKTRIEEMKSALTMLNQLVSDDDFKKSDPMVQIDVIRIANYGSTLSNSVNTVAASISDCDRNINNQVFITRLLKDIDGFIADYKQIFGITNL